MFAKVAKLRSGSRLFSEQSSQFQASFGKHFHVAANAPSTSNKLAVYVAGFAASAFALHQVSKSESVFGWGSNQYGQLGVGDEITRPLPCEVESVKSLDVVQVASGGDSILLLTKAGEVYSAGRGQYGVLGHGDDGQVVTPQRIELLAHLKFVSVAASELHAAGVTDTGDLYTWGSAPALGRASKGISPPQKLDVGGKKIASVSCGRQHMLAVAEDGSLYSWGKGDEGALGLGGKQNKEVPQFVELLKDKKVVQSAAGRASSIVRTADGEVYTFGANDYGQTGHGSSAERTTKVPALVRAFSNKNVVDIAMGDYHTCAATGDGEVYCWGFGSDGQIGNNHKQVHNTSPALVSSLKGKHIVSVSCGEGHTAALAKDGTLYVWGRGRDGQIGRADKLESQAAYRPVPVEVTYFPVNKKKVTQVSLGKNHSTVLAK